MNRNTKIGAGVAAGAAALAAGGVIAFAALASTTASAAETTPTPSATAPGDGTRGRGPGGPGMGETALTGDQAAKATAAAKKAVPGGTIDRVETDNGGTFEAHVTKTDGTQVEVKMDKDFGVTSIEAHTGGPGHGPADSATTGTPSASPTA